MGTFYTFVTEAFYSHLESDMEQCQKMEGVLNEMLEDEPGDFGYQKITVDRPTGVKVFYFTGYNRTTGGYPMIEAGVWFTSRMVWIDNELGHGGYNLEKDIENDIE